MFSVSPLSLRLLTSLMYLYMPLKPSFVKHFTLHVQSELQSAQIDFGFNLECKMILQQKKKTNMRKLLIINMGVFLHAEIQHYSLLTFHSFCIALNKHIATYPFIKQMICSLCFPSSLFTHLYAPDLKSECTCDCVSLFIDMFDSMPEQSPTTESKAATTPSVDLFGAGTRVDIHFCVYGTSSSSGFHVSSVNSFFLHVLVCPP